MISGCSFIRRKDGLDVSQFEHHWLNVHGPLAAAQFGVKRYIQNHLDRKSPAMNAQALGLQIDGIAQIWFENETDRDACYSSPQAKVCDVDSLLFIGASSRVRTNVIQHRPVRPKPAAAKLIVLRTGEAAAEDADIVGYLSAAPGAETLVEHTDIRAGAIPKTDRPTIGLQVAALCEACFDGIEARDRAAQQMAREFGPDGLSLIACHEHKII